MTKRTEKMWNGNENAVDDDLIYWSIKKQSWIFMEMRV